MKTKLTNGETGRQEIGLKLKKNLKLLWISEDICVVTPLQTGRGPKRFNDSFVFFYGHVFGFCVRFSTVGTVPGSVLWPAVAVAVAVVDLAQLGLYISHTSPVGQVTLYNNNSL